MDELDLLKRKLERERKARKQAEAILEAKALELFELNQELEQLNNSKDDLLESVSKALTCLFDEDDLYHALQSSINILGNSHISDRVSISLFTYKNKQLTFDRLFVHEKEESKSAIRYLDSNNQWSTITKFLENHVIGKRVSKFALEDSITTEIPVIKKMMELLGVSSMYVIPIELKNDIVAFIRFDFVELNYTWSTWEESVLMAFVAGVESAIDRYFSKIEKENQRIFFENILNNLPNDLVVFDDKHRYQFINPVAITNKEVREWLIGKDDFQYVEERNKPIEIAEKRRKTFNQAISAKEPLTFEEELINRHGEREWKMRTLFPVFKNDSELEMVIGYGLDITDIKNKSEEVKKASIRLTTLISSLNSGILLENQVREILVTNQEFCDLFEIPGTPEQLVGYDCSESAERSKHLVENSEEFVREIDQLIFEKKVRTNQEVVFKNGKVYERDFIPIFLDNRYLGHLWEYRDITERKEAERALIKAREIAEESKRLKQKFLANMSHEIRTPMNGVMGIVYLLEKTNLNADQKKYLNILKDSSEHLLHIINDILDVSKIEEGKLVLAKTPVEMDVIIEGVYQNLKTRAEDKKLKFQVQGLNIFKSPLLTDPVRIRQILLNLLTNAIKFTHTGFIKIIARTLEETDERQRFSVCIIDSGIGIPKEKVATIFNAFDQVSTDTTSSYGGTGLGLNIVRDLVSKMNADIDVQSKINEGTKFTITFDFEKGGFEDLVSGTHKKIIQPNSFLIGKNILVADDHKINFEIAKEIITDWGGSVLYAQDGEKALEVLLSERVDLILMDMQMPKMDGIETTKMIRTLEAPLGTIPIIAMTAAALPEERERCLQSGMNDYIAKPYNPDFLFNILMNYLSAEKSTLNSLDITSGENDLVSSFDLGYLKELSGNNSEFIFRMIDTFKEEMPEMMTEMVRFLKDSDYPAINRVAHKAKSMCSYLGCTPLRNIMIELENPKVEVSQIEELIEKSQNELERILNDLNNQML